MVLPPSVEEGFLQRLSRDKTTVSVFLKTGIRLTRKIESFDRYTVELASPRGSQSIMKHAIATVLPGGGNRLLAPHPTSRKPQSAN
ncbi:RNA chaperone Hfq [Paraburkholderia sp. UCT31]|uniref:RNA chaperone Hfq n=1 Tax=Paraburkholderia sp. UCT31 TaxID=2615209 RepID=UPI0016565AE1|nr:RNA chaperone Hfq [Paraburkholderia sp. UCT31]MBC8742917.1 RNA chaperone Hfq [Paraburkholderia sp. UCT31]